MSVLADTNRSYLTYAAVHSSSHPCTIVLNVYVFCCPPVGGESRSLVALGACTFTLVSQFGFVGKADQARVAASVASGVGFIGAGVSEWVRKAEPACTVCMGERRAPFTLFLLQP